MSCHQRSRTLSSDGCKDGLRRPHTSTAVGDTSSTMTHSVSAASSSRLPPLRPKATTPLDPSPPRGLARYVQGLAAGEDLAELICGLHGSLIACYEDCMRTTAPSFTHPQTLETTKTPPATAEVTGGTSPLPATPHPLPRSALSAAQRGDYWAATKTALLFASESAPAAEAATVLHCSPVTRSVLFPYYYPTGQVEAAAAHSSSTSFPLSGVLHRGDMRMILSDVRMAELARDAVRHNSRDGWQEALRLLHQVSPTPLTCAVEVELYRQTGGQHWAEALQCLWTIPTAQWTEMDVGSVLRCLYHAGRQHTKQAGQIGLAGSAQRPVKGNDVNSGAGVDDSAAHGDVFLARLIAQALRVHRAVEEAGVLQWSTPSAFNDTLGLVAQDPAAWRDACLLLDKLIAAQQAVSTAFTTSAAETSRAAPGVTSAASSLALYRLVRPNAVTVHQTCQTLRQHWETGLRYVQLLQETAGATMDLVSDVAATEDVLRLCIAGHRWQEALALVEARQAGVTSPLHPMRPALPSARAVATAELPGARRHYRPDVFVQLVRLLGSVPEARPAAYALVKSHEAAQVEPAAPAAVAAVAGDVRASRHWSGELGRSKHYNRDTLSRAYNCLVQGSATLDAADPVVCQLNQHYGDVRDSATVLLSTAASTLPFLEKEHERMLAGLETESVAHIAYLCCVAGNWQRALHHTNALLHAPRYQATFFPTSRLHDAVQYALEQAPAPGPSWEVSLRLFTDMMDRNLPNSEVAFKSAVKRCFAGGVPEQAQRLFHLLLKTGVRS